MLVSTLVALVVMAGTVISLIPEPMLLRLEKARLRRKERKEERTANHECSLCGNVGCPDCTLAKAAYVPEVNYRRIAIETMIRKGIEKPIKYRSLPTHPIDEEEHEAVQQKLESLPLRYYDFGNRRREAIEAAKIQSALKDQNDEKDL